MCTHTITGLMTILVLALANVLPDAARAQTDSAKPAIADSSTKPIGKVVAVTGSVTVEHAGAVVVQANTSDERSRTKIGDLVYQGDTVQTGPDGRVGINFIDGASFNLSSNARMALDEYVYDPNGKSNSTFFSLAKGTFTFVSGKVAKTGDMKIDTPVATMGIRGTTPHVEISDNGGVKFSTLIEESKSKTNNKTNKKSGANTAVPSEQKAERKLNLNICRRC